MKKKIILGLTLVAGVVAGICIARNCFKEEDKIYEWPGEDGVATPVAGNDPDSDETGSEQQVTCDESAASNASAAE